MVTISQNNNLKCIHVNENILISYEIKWKYFPGAWLVTIGSNINYKSVLVRLFNVKPLLESVVTQLTAEYMSHP